MYNTSRDTASLKILKKSLGVKSKFYFSYGKSKMKKIKLAKKKKKKIGGGEVFLKDFLCFGLLVL